MNKHLYKVIFNQERGQMMVVPENATAQGQSSTNTSAENPVAEPVDSSFVSGCLKPLTFSLMLMFGTAFISETVEAANIQADKNAPKNEQPIVLQTPNGLPQVNIQTPSKAGVSVNQYRQFDVDEKGAILNNSRTNTQTQQAGWIQGNPLLATGEAKIIVNQVNSQNPSLLNGYVEVGGKRSEVILANPAGIQVNGGGFINTQSATLSTGQTLIRSGQLDQYAVHDGKISIKGKGLNAKDTDFTKIIGRYVEVDAPIAANDLTVIAGQNTVSADGKIQAAAKNTPKQKAVAIDTSELGGMYANKITLISTENNQSIDNKGQVFANAGGVTLDSQGNLSNAGTIASQGKTDIKAKDLDNSGTLSSKDKFDVKADNVDNSGTVLAANELNARVSGSMKQGKSGHIEAARLDVETAKLDNAGTISQTGLQGLAIESTGALTNSGKIGYPEADNTAPTTANGGTTGTTAPTQNTPSSATGSGNATAVSSPSSIQNFATGNLKTRETLNNSGTINANGGVDLTAKNGLKNTAELQLNKLAVSGNVLDNSQAKISAQSTDIQTQSVNNAQGELIASKTLNISTGQLDNRAGKLQSVDNANLTVSGSLNNQKGEIAANNALAIQDKQAQNLHIDNTDGTIVANHVSLQSKSLNNQGKLAAGNHLSIDLKDDFTVERNLEAGNKLNIKTAGSLNNSQTIQAESEVNIQAKQNISNRGTMNSNGLTRVEAGQELLNIGTGKIYGNHVALAADSVVNRDENGKAAVVAARERLDIGAKNITNKTDTFLPSNTESYSKLHSEGTLTIGQKLNEQNQATGTANSLINASALISSQADMKLSTTELNNQNIHFTSVVREIEGSRKDLVEYEPDSPHSPHKKGEKYDSSHVTGWGGEDTVYLDGNKYEDYTRYKYTRYETQHEVETSAPSVISSGGKLSLDGQNLVNDKSHILAKSIDTIGKDVKNIDAEGEHRIKGENGHKIHHYVGWNSLGTSHKSKWDNEDKNYKPNDIVTSIKLNVFKYDDHYQGHTPSITVQTSDAIDKQTKIKSLTNNSITLPTNSLYTINPNHSGWLVETDPAFANYKQWLGSDFMLNALKTDPNHMHKRLGDGYYEQKLVNEQINRLTGYRRLDGYNNDEEQFKALMNSGITAAKEFGLSLGVSLSAEQVARLTSDIVWLETQTVTLPDGSTQTVLVPKVYVVARKDDLNASGSLLSADKINLNIANGTLENGGTIGARQVVAINAKDIENGGHLQANQIGLQATDNIKFNGGTAQAEQLFSASAKNIDLTSNTRSTGDKNNGNTVMDRVAAVYVSGDEKGQGVLHLNATQNLNLNAAHLSNTASNGTTVLQGQNINIGTIKTENHETDGQLSDKNHRHVHKTTEIGSQIHTQGNIAIVGDNITVRQSDIQSDAGHVALAAKEQLRIEEGRQTKDMDISIHTESKQLLSSKKDLNQFEGHYNEAMGSTITGQSIDLSSKNISIRGSDVIATDDVRIQAKENVSITAAQNQHTASEYQETKKSGLMSTGGFGVTIGSKQTTDEQDNTSLTHTASTVGSLKGNTTIVAGKNYEQTGSIVRSIEGDTLISAQKIDVKAAENRYTNDHIHTEQQKGLTVAVNVPVVQLAQSALAIADTAKQVGQSKNDRVNAMAAANTAWQAYETGKSATEMMGQDGKPLDVSVSLTYGEQKNRHESHRTTTEAESSLVQSGGTSTLIATGAGKESDINITGSDVLGGKGTYLLADDAINLTSAQQRSTENSSNKSSGWNAGISASYGQNGMAFGITAGGNYGKGHGNGESVTHRHTQVGDSNSATVLQSGGKTTIKGAQVHGKGIDLSAQDLLIESVQDTEKFNSKQQNIQAQATVGYGASFSGSYSQSKVNADHASVSQQSGLYAGDEGYRVQVANHTDLKGALITSTAKAEADGKNQFSTKTLSHSDIENHSHYDAKGFGIGGGMSVSGKTLGQGEQNNPQESHLKTVADKNGTSSSIGYGNDSDSQSSVTRSGINTQNIRITDEAKQIQLTGKTAEESKAQIHTDTTTDTAQALSGSLKNVFDKEAVQSELDLQVQVTKEFGTVAPNLVANASEKLGNVSEYETVALIKADAEKTLAQTSDETERTKLVQIIQQADEYLATNKTTYETWKEGGIGRALLQSGVGGLMTGNVNGALAGGSTSLAAPYLNEAEEKLGSTGTLINALGGAAIGYATGGSGGAVVGANVDWHNRQLHPSEYKLAEQYADIVASRLKISREEALGRIIRHMQRTVDYATAKADNFRTDDAIISILGANNLPKQDQHYTNPNYNKQYIQNYVRDFNLANQYNYFGKTPTQSRNYKVGVVTDIGKAALNSGIGIFESAANLATGEIDPNSWAYVHMGRIDYTHPEYGNALENTMTLGVAAVTAGRGVKTDVSSIGKAKIEINNPVLNNIRTGSALKTDELHAFNNIIDNYAGQATRFNLKGGDGVERSLYQLEGSLNGKKGVFEWIIDPNPAKGVVHRRFIENVQITGKPNARPIKGK